MTQPKKKSHKKLIAGVIVLVLVLSMAATAFAFQDTLFNTFAMMTKSPQNYYAYVEEKAISDSVDKITPYLNLTNSNAKKNFAYQTSVNVSYDRDTINSLLQSTLGVSMDDLESTYGIKLDNIGFNTTVATKDGNLYDSLGLSLNQVDVITLEIFMDTVKQELSDAGSGIKPSLFKTVLDSRWG